MDDERHILWLIEQSGWECCAAIDQDEAVVEAARDGVRHIVRAETPYVAGCELARKVGVELRDG